MGCVVNGPGEAKDADIGIAGGIKKAYYLKRDRLSEKFHKKNC